MKKPKRKKAARRTDYFAFFRKTAGEIFEPLLGRYDLKQVSIFEQMPECSLRYHNESTGLGVDVGYEWKSGIWVELLRVEQTSDGPLDAERYGIDHLLAVRCPDKSVSDQFASIEWTNEDIERILRAYAGLLEECARDVLLGDFRVFPRLKKITQQLEAEERKRMLS